MYRTTQPGNLVAALLLACLALVAGVGYATGWHPIALAVAVLLALVLVIFRSLTIEIDDAELRCWFGDGLIRRRFSLADITAATPVRNKWFYGWGVERVSAQAPHASVKISTAPMICRRRICFISDGWLDRAAPVPVSKLVTQSLYQCRLSASAAGLPTHRANQLTRFPLSSG